MNIEPKRPGSQLLLELLRWNVEVLCDAVEIGTAHPIQVPVQFIPQ
jgi:hypothetical protein